MKRLAFNFWEIGSRCFLIAMKFELPWLLGEWLHVHHAGLCRDQPWQWHSVQLHWSKTKLVKTSFKDCARKLINGSYHLDDKKNIEFSKDKKMIRNLSILKSLFGNNLDKRDWNDTINCIQSNSIIVLIVIFLASMIEYIKWYQTLLRFLLTISLKS